MSIQHFRLLSATACVAASIVATTSTAAAQWPGNASTNLQIASGAGDQVVEKLAIAPDGSVYISWFDNNSGNYDVRLQKLSGAGVAQWGANGILVSNHPQSTSLVDWDLIADSQGNAVLAFTDTRAGGDLDVYAYAFDAAGNALWGANGVAISNNSDYEVSPKIAEATNGDFVIVWPRLPNTGDGKIYMQRLTAAGAPLLAAGGIPVAGEAGRNPAFCNIVATTNGDVIVSFVRDIKTFSSPRHVRAERFDAAGASVWGAPLAVFDAGSVPIGYDPKLKSDGNGGAVLVWHYAAVSTFNSYAQRVSGAGAEAWAHNGITVSTSTTNNHLDPTFDYRPATGETFLFWTEENSNQSQYGIYAQKLSANGLRKWGATGKVILPVDNVYKFLPQCIQYADGAIVYFTQEITTPSQNYKIVGQRVDTLGNALWNGGVPVTASSAISNKGRLVARGDSNGFARLVWEDQRNGSADLYAQGMRADGTPGTEGLAGYGAATPGCAGASHTFTEILPKIGQPLFNIQTDNGPASSLGICIITDAQDPAGSDPFGLGVALHVDLLAATEIFALDMPTDAGGLGTAPASIPNDPLLVGKNYYAQTLFVWTGICALPPLDISASDALKITILH